MSIRVPIVKLENVSKEFSLRHNKSLKETVLSKARGQASDTTFKALSHVNLEINSGTTVGLIGHNGSGKSTLLKVIGGILAPSAGSVARRGRLAALLELGAGFHPDLTGRENIYLNAAILGLSAKETDRHMDEIIDFSGIEEFIDTQVKFYSSGMYVRLGFSVAIHVDPDLLLVDEVLAVGDEPFQRKCMTKISDFQAEGRTIIVVSHSSGQIKSLCDRVVLMDEGKAIFDGDTQEGVDRLHNLYVEQGMGDTVQAGARVERSDVMEITSVTTELLRTGDTSDFDVRFAVDIRQQVPDWGLRMSVISAGGARLFGSDTFSSEGKKIDRLGEQEITFSFRDVPLGAGGYFVRGALCTEDISEVFFAAANMSKLVIPSYVGDKNMIRVESSFVSNSDS